MSESTRRLRGLQLLWMGSLALVSFWVGCSRSTPDATESQTQSADSAQQPAESASAVDPSDVELTVVDRAAYDQLIEGLDGKVVLVDCWATWCTPCIEQLPHSAALSREHGDKGLAVVLLSLDSPSEAETIRTVVARTGGAGLINLVSQFGSGSESAEVFEIPGGALPHYKLYDRTGKLRRTFGLDPAAEQQFTPEDVATAVKELLAE